MTPTITAEQCEAIDRQPGVPIFVADPDRRQEYVLITAEDFRHVCGLYADDADRAEWTSQDDDRRRELIHEFVTRTAGDEELPEFGVLQARSNGHFDAIAPRPTEGVLQLYKQLLEARDGQP